MPKAPTQVLGLAPEVEVRQPPSPYPVRLFWFSGVETAQGQIASAALTYS